MSDIENDKLINKNRIDIVIGIEYVDFYENNYNTNFFIDLHIEHKKAWNGLKEENYVGKEQHIDRFKNIIDGIKNTKTNTTTIQVYNYNNEYWVVNGFHRISTLIYYNLKKNLRIDSLQIPPKKDYYPTNIYFLRNKNYDLKYCNYTMFSFLKNYHKVFSCIILFPNSKSLPNNLSKKINKKIIYDVDIPLKNFNRNFNNNFIQLLYYNEGWCKKGQYIDKAKACFKYGNNLKLYFIEKQALKKLTFLKTRIREYYQNGNHSIHIPDTQEECNTLLDVLNYNTLSFMDKAQSLYINFTNFNRLFEKLKEFCKKHSIDTKKICITSSSVLSVYGIRDCGDMDLFIDKKYTDIFQNTCFDNHNKYTCDKHYSKHFEDIIYNPDNHFYYQSIKFCKLSIILDYKQYRVANKLYGNLSIKKDCKDIKRILKIW